MKENELAGARQELVARLYGLRPDWIADVRLVRTDDRTLTYKLTVTLEINRWMRSDGNGGQRPETEEEVLARYVPRSHPKKQPAP